ncbi:MAG: hypothetical protein AAGJ18_22830 [Bacteroidota bacterium]
MKIINPIYDHAFKYLMQNNRIAKKVLSTLLECEVVELVVEQQEMITVDESRGFKLYRLDFSAIIINEEGQKQKVLIELQKSKLPTNLIRFRSYLGESYTKKEVVTNALGAEENKVYPIISIYILGYNVVDIPYLAVNIDNKITNAVTKKEVKVASDFINLLTHKTRIIQVRRLQAKRKSRLERFLLLFNQAWITADKFILELEEIPEEFNDIVNYLRGPVQDEAFRKKLRGEEEIDDIFRNQEAQLLRQQEALLVAKHNEAIAKEQVQAMQIKFARHLLEQKTPIGEIVRLTGLEADIVLGL